MALNTTVLENMFRLLEAQLDSQEDEALTGHIHMIELLPIQTDYLREFANRCRNLLEKRAQDRFNEKMWQKASEANRAGAEWLQYQEELRAERERLRKKGIKPNYWR